MKPQTWNEVRLHLINIGTTVPELRRVTQSANKTQGIRDWIEGKRIPSCVTLRSLLRHYYQWTIESPPELIAKLQGATRGKQGMARKIANATGANLRVVNAWINEESWPKAHHYLQLRKFLLDY